MHRVIVVVCDEEIGDIIPFWLPPFHLSSFLECEEKLISFNSAEVANISHHLRILVSQLKPTSTYNSVNDFVPPTALEM